MTSQDITKAVTGLMGAAIMYKAADTTIDLIAGKKKRRRRKK